MKTQIKAVEELKEKIIGRLSDYAGGNHYACDLAHTLFEGESANGSVLCNTYATKEFIKENWDLFADLVEYWKDSTGETLNPFAEPEKCHVIFEKEAASAILSRCPTIEEKWNEMIKKLSKEINAFDGDLF